MMKWWGWGSIDKTYDIARRPKLFAFMEAYTGISCKDYRDPVKEEEIILPTVYLNSVFLEELHIMLSREQIKTDRSTRLHHCYGKSYRDLLRIRAGVVQNAPDIIVYPRSHEEVVQIVMSADRHQVNIIAFGGGTNIVGGVEALSGAKRRTHLVLNMQLMDRLLDLDEASLTATLETGILGPQLEEKLNARGFSFGHFPDSFEFSTLGGCLATRSAGMQSDLYGKIEDMVVNLKMVCPKGVIVTPNVPKAAAGPDFNQIIVGSEGILGVITEVTIKIHPLRKMEYRGLLIQNFGSGVAFLQKCMQQNCMPAMVRVSNDHETALGFALRTTEKKWLNVLLSRVASLYFKKLKKMDLQTASILIIGLQETTANSIKSQRKKIMRIGRTLGTIDLGREPGNKWFAGKYDYPYIRDVFMNYGGVVDVTETSVSWSKVLPLYTAVSEKMRGIMRIANIPGYLGCHISHSYHSGACLYFTFAVRGNSDYPLSQYLDLKQAIVEEILAQDGALSHHHAIGYEHQPWFGNYVGSVTLEALWGLKNKLDPNNICNPGKLLPTSEYRLQKYWPFWEHSSRLMAQPKEELAP